jgi:adenine phosphoribosyltransferase
MDLKQHVRDVPDFPRAGILFRDISPLLRHHFEAVVDATSALIAAPQWHEIDAVAGIESRGFILAAALALRHGKGFVPIRKQGKLPGQTIGEDYALEYGTDRVEMHRDAVAPGEAVLLVDDLVATGGTAEAACRLIEHAGGRVLRCCFVIELTDLGGRRRLEQLGYEVQALAAFEGD